MSKATLYSRPQKAFLLFNPGTGKQVQLETKEILSNPFLQSKHTPSLSLSANELELSSTSLYSLVEVLLRSQCAQDLRLHIAEGPVYFESSFRKLCEKVSWSNYIQEGTALHLNLNSVSSRLFHESMLKKMLTEIFKKKNILIVNKEEEALSTLHVHIHKDKASFSLSLAGNALYQRGFRELGSTHAPLREDIAQTCMREALLLSKGSIENLWIPFGGSGTFLFEYLMKDSNIAPCLLRKSYALEAFSFFNKKNFDFIRSKSLSQVKTSSLKKIIYCDYNEEASQVFQKNLRSFSEKLSTLTLPELQISTENIFSSPAPHFEGNIFIPLNPPYGLRLHSKSDIPSLYTKIAKKVLELMQSNAHSQVVGFILCPSEDSWSAFSKVMKGKAKLSTYHITQGSLDLRVCSFVNL